MARWANDASVPMTLDYFEAMGGERVAGIASHLTLRQGGRPHHTGQCGYCDGRASIRGTVQPVGGLPGSGDCFLLGFYGSKYPRSGIPRSLYQW